MKRVNSTTTFLALRDCFVECQCEKRRLKRLKVNFHGKKLGEERKKAVNGMTRMSNFYDNFNGNEMTRMKGNCVNIREEDIFQRKKKTANLSKKKGQSQSFISSSVKSILTMTQ
jgi:hypothetical protein